jgi:hypothetical protein
MSSLSLRIRQCAQKGLIGLTFCLMDFAVGHGIATMPIAIAALLQKPALLQSR